MRSILLLLVFLSGCAEVAPSVRFFEEQHSPQDLNEWGMLYLSDGKLKTNQRVLSFDLNTPLFSDYAHKLRTIWMPEGQSAVYGADDFEYPIGTTITKTFYYPKNKYGELLLNEDYSRDFINGALNLETVHLVETRLLVRHKNGWQTLPYVWNQEQTNASLEIAGDVQQLNLIAPNSKTTQQVNYIVPDTNQCAGCHADNHTAAKVVPIGARPRHLNKNYNYPDVGKRNQLQQWADLGMLKGLLDIKGVNRLIPAFEHGASVSTRARSYLDINCGHCHNPNGPADTSGLFLQHNNQDTLHLGYCKPPVAAGRGAGNLKYAINPGDADTSILVYRMLSTDPGQLMPELGRSIVHEEGVTLVSEWINQMSDVDCSAKQSG
jgi:uncharacterized repeat protein (TIGR03806 family)